MVSICRDITKRKSAEEALLASEKKYRSLVEQVNDWVWEIDANGKYSYASPQVRGLLGYEPGELIGTSPLDYMAPGESERVKALFDPIFEAHEEFSLLENKLVKKDGGMVTVETSGVPIFDARGTFTGYRGIDRDITARKRAEEALWESEGKYRIVADNTYDWEFWLSPEEQVVYTSPSCERITGYSAGELTKNPGLLYEITQPEDKPAFLAHIHAQQPSSHSELEFRIVARNGEVRWIHHLCQPVYDRDGRFLGYRGSNRDITKRKRAEQALNRDRYILAKSQEVARVGNWAWDLQTGEIMGSAENYRIFGYEPGEVKPTPEWVLSRVLPDDRTMLADFMEARTKDGKRGSIDYRILGPDGSVRYVNMIVDKAVRDRSGKIKRLYGISQDVTERKLAEEALKNSEAKFKAIFEGAGAAIFIADVETGNIIDCNTNAEVLMGRPRSEVIGMHQSRVHPEGEEEKYKKIFALHGREGSFKDTEAEVQHKDGRRIPVWINAQLLKIDGRDMLIGLFFDITERKRAEEAVRLAGVYNRSLIESSLDPLVTISPDGVITDVNKATEAVTGYPREKLIDTDFSDYFTEPDKAKEGYRTAFKQGSVMDYALEIRHKDGHITPVIYNASVYRDEAGKVIGVFAAARDITERRRAENALRDAKDQVELYVDLMGHDINNMNQVSMGFLELAHNIIEMEGKLSEDNIVLLDKAMDSLNNSSQLIENVRKLQREKMGLYEPEVLDVGSVIEDAVKQFHGIPGRDVKITCTYPGHCFVRANALLKDVFINLVGNAVKHSRGSLSINIAVSRVVDNDKTYYRVDVEDDGPGIPDTLKHTLFDRLSLTMTRAKGKGFGLCLIKMLVDDFHGKFWVEDRIRGDHTKGCRFVVMLPTVESD